MSTIEAIILGLIQGLTEFLPVSSSGHIELGKEIFGIEAKEAGMLFTVVLHFATALSTLVVFWKDIVGLFKGLFKFKWNEETRYVSFIVLSMIPAVMVGLLWKDEIEALFSGNVMLVSVMLLVTGIVLYLSDRMPQTTESVSASKALIIGVVQAIAILPGISRSGSTIAGSVLLNINREKAARFSFLMVLPVIMGAMLMEVKDILDTPSYEQAALNVNLNMVVGFLAAFISGYAACRWMISIVKRSKLTYFAIYCWVVGLLGLTYSLI